MLHPPWHAANQCRHFAVVIPWIRPALPIVEARIVHVVVGKLVAVFSSALIDLEDVELFRELGLAYRRDRTLSCASTAFIDILLQMSTPTASKKTLPPIQA